MPHAQTPPPTPKRHHHSHTHKYTPNHKKRPHEDHSPTTTTTTPHPSPSKRRKAIPTHSTRNALSAHPTTTISPFVTQTATLNLPLSPITTSQPLTGLCAEHLSPHLLSYLPHLQGILLAYRAPRLAAPPPSTSTDPPVYARTVADCAPPLAWLTAEFTLLRPMRGAEMEGYVTVQNENRVGLLCWNLFNASVERRRLPRGWRWTGPRAPVRRARRVNGNYDEEESEEDTSAREADAETEAEGTFVDETGAGITDRLLKFRVTDWELDVAPRNSDASTGAAARLMSFEGTMLTGEEEAGLEREAMAKEAERRRGERLKERQRERRRRQSDVDEAT